MVQSEKTIEQSYPILRHSNYLGGVFCLSRIRLIVAVAIVSFVADDANAQLFGSRTLGRPLTTRSNSAELGSSFRIRRSGGFVGSDRRDASRFIGRSQAATGQRPRSATTGLRSNSNSGGSLNQPIQQPGRNTMYLPRITLAPNDSATTTQNSSSLESDLSRRMKSNFGPSLQVTFEDRVAKLTGTVESAKTRRIAELVIGFEPRVSSVQNDLQVVGETASPPAEPRASQ